MTRKEIAMNNFLSGYNCTQALTLAFEDILPIDRESLLKLSGPFGGGMGRLREVCGAVSGMLIVIGLLYGYDTPETGDKKIALYAKVRKVAEQFEKEHSSIVCRDILGLDVKHDSPIPEARTPEYYGKRPCAGCVGDAAEILSDFINENPVE